MKNQPSRGAGDAPLRRRRLSIHRCRHRGGAAVTGDLQPSTDITTNNIIHVSIQPPASTPGHRPESTSEPAAAEFGGTCGGVPSVPARFPALTVT